MQASEITAALNHRIRVLCWLRHNDGDTTERLATLRRRLHAMRHARSDDPRQYDEEEVRKLLQACDAYARKPPPHLRTRRGRPYLPPDQTTIAGLIGMRIRAARKKKRMDTATFAEALGVPRKTIYNWETGRALPAIDRALEICAVLGVKIEKLVAKEPSR